jgi:hypothetical protein
MQRRYVPFRPNLSGIYADRFYERIRELYEKSKKSFEEIDNTAQEETRWAEQQYLNPKQIKIFCAVWFLFRDLMRTGWAFRWNAGVEVAPPIIKDSAHSGEEALAIKDQIRKMMFGAKLEKLVESKDFILRMESPAKSGLAKVPINVLVADGKALAKDLETLRNLKSEAEKLVNLKGIINPYLQLVSENERCKETGFLLSDIWRYFRLTWATPAENTPGRTMLYLIRDAARPFHPVIAIASLENAPFRITPRDNFLGWTPDIYLKSLEGKTSQEVYIELKKLLTHLKNAIKEIDFRSICTPDEIENPTQELLQRLANIAARSNEERKTTLRAWRQKPDNLIEDEATDTRKSDLGNISVDTEKALYKEKRAEQLGRLLTAYLDLDQIFLPNGELDSNYSKLLISDIGRNSIRQALITIKNKHIGTSMLELNVCGAIPPYNELLAGKLAAFLMISPEVVNDYKDRYGDRPSDIASRMKGENVVRPANLIFVSTSSLYQVGSSQYNRLKFPAGLLRPDAPEVKWYEIGKTSGFGTLHISRKTNEYLEEAAKDDDGLKYVNHIFGEGPSPKLRAIRDALSVILEPGYSDELTKHSMSRIIYGVWLANNGYDIFRGEDVAPDYYFNPFEPVNLGTNRIIEFWMKRWLLGRANNADVIKKISQFDISSLLPSQYITDFGTTENEVISKREELDMETNSGEIDNTFRDFVRGLYRGSSSYADEIHNDMLQKIHIETRLDKAVINAVKEQKSVILTGNPGDGKTHILRILETSLKRISPSPIIELDASAITNLQLKNTWQNAINSGIPFCAAINQAVLKNLAEEFPYFAPLQDAWTQVENAVVYGSSSLTDFNKSSVIVFDLSRRNILSKDIVSSAILKLTDPNRLTPCHKCPSEGCDLTRNRELILSPLYQERLQEILYRVARRGYHATLRDLLGFISFLLFAGRSCEKMLSGSGDRAFSLPQLPYKGKGAFFEIIRETFDPRNVSHPIWDEILVKGSTPASGWVDTWFSEADAINPDILARFEQRKRAFYFLHSDGNILLNISGDDEGLFATFLKQAKESSPKTLRELIKKINVFFGDESGSDALRVWQSHRYNQSSRSILYSASNKPRQDFEIVLPQLSSTMINAFEIIEDHLILRLKNRKRASLRVDFSLFEMLLQAERGVPMLSLDNELTRRVWQFMEQLAEPINIEEQDEVQVTILDPTINERMTITVDTPNKKYITVRKV